MRFTIFIVACALHISGFAGAPVAASDTPHHTQLKSMVVRYAEANGVPG